MSGNYPGYCVISTQIEEGEKGRNWLDNTLLLVKLRRSGPEAFYLARNFSVRKEYWDESHATITRDGRSVLWATNQGTHAGRNQPFLLLLAMPPSWQELLK